ncbi:conserved hypothetical protein [Leishmania infantum JPCM5]|uniref:Uncharacterized protein n=3 Tax=Leishmania donovani species complex TaxID=38574 RepID=A4I3H4_LEIIN|nr:conserved hypothetical protein [Leishmania infantum JPCM5]XP_003862205.1 hypothetical protein, conserved [Leishmania donovani]CAC9502722.1 hypothetical_protein_-_conserved [Leishmania infantum]AYU80256.1 hypothetical protein LdCL_280015200 [Leishmania donovani]TPP54245.1 hypothetical protein CGC21_22020 [Leishmania donovani]CAM69328.1 conserved hypothetical protein [Leishmania infantum JPCM5]CBZ35511.1 hypothetical protein, conserved [Leishmania donovani]|eukprot:XP_001470136.1 conserved hypothetical protein [Leishmania infantum JPCM5]
MSANVNFSAGSRTTKTAPSGPAVSPSAKNKSHMILPYEVLFNLVGRRVTVLLTKGSQELEGTLQSVDSDKGDMLLSDVVRYTWAPSRSSDEEETAAAAAGNGQCTLGTVSEEEGCSKCFGGGQRRELSRCSQAMLNSAFVALVTPTLFIPEERHSALRAHEHTIA